jgi:hypothetical protein
MLSVDALKNFPQSTQLISSVDISSLKFYEKGHAIFIDLSQIEIWQYPRKLRLP